MNLSDLSAPFPPEDVEWRVVNAGISKNGSGTIYCNVVAYIRTRAIQRRLDDVCEPQGWKNEPLQVHELRPGVVAMQAGITIRIGEEWVTKWDVSMPGETKDIDAAKTGFTGASKRAAAQWGIGRELRYLGVVRATVSESGGRGWRYAKLTKEHGYKAYYWQEPKLPEWILPKEAEHEISSDELNQLKNDWKAKFATDGSSRAE